MQRFTVARRLARSLLRPRAGAATATPDRAATSTPPDPARRLRQALDAVAQVEGLEDSLPTATLEREMWSRRRVARVPDLPPGLTDMLPLVDREDWSAEAPGVRVHRVPVSADLLVLAKFDMSEQVKLRAAYAETQRTLALQPPRAGVDGIAQALAAHQVVPRHAPGLMPPLCGHGRLRSGLPYLVEGWVEGAKLVTGEELSEAAPQLLADLSAVHRGHGITGVRLSTQHGRLVDDWARTVGAGIVPAELGRWVADLLETDPVLRHSWVHGDLVASNVLRSSQRFVLLDWELSRHGALMDDAAKLHLFSADHDRILGEVLTAFGDSPSGSGRLAERQACSPAQELAIAHAKLISRFPRRSAALEGHPRAAVYARQVRRQVERLARVRDVT